MAQAYVEKAVDISNTGAINGRITDVEVLVDGICWWKRDHGVVEGSVPFCVPNLDRTFIRSKSLHRMVYRRVDYAGWVDVPVIVVAMVGVHADTHTICLRAVFRHATVAVCIVGCSGWWRLFVERIAFPFRGGGG